MAIKADYGTLNSCEGSLLTRFIEKRFIEGQSAPDSEIQEKVRRVLQLLSLGLGTAGSAFFAPISKKFAGDDYPVWGNALATGNAGSFAALNAWSLFNIVDAFLAPKTVEEQQIEKMSIAPTCGNRTIKGLTIPIGMICQIPLSYQAYYYNNNSALSGIFTMISDSGIPIYSLLLMADEYLRGKSLNPIEKKFNETKAVLIQRLTENEQSLLELDSSERSVRAEALTRLDGMDLKTALQTIFDRIGPEKRESCLRTGGRYAAKLLGGSVFTAVRLLNAGVLGSKAVELFGAPDWVCDLSGAIIAGCSYKLTWNSMTHTVQKTYDFVIDLVSRQFKPSLSTILNSPLQGTLLGIGLIFSALSWAPSVQVPRDNFSGDLEQAMEYLLPASSILMVSHAVSDLVNDFVVNYSRLMGSKDEQRLVEVHNRYQSLIQAIKHSTIIDLAHLLKALPSDLLRECYNKAQVTEPELNAYTATAFNSDTCSDSSDEVEDPFLPLSLQQSSGESPA